MKKWNEDRPWRAAWPPQVIEVLEDLRTPDVPWKSQIGRYRRIFQAMEGREGASCGVAEIENLVSRMNAWSQRHSALFSWPASMDGWSRAVWATMAEPGGREDMAWLMAGYGPSVRVALSAKPAAPAWSERLVAALGEMDATPAAPAPPQRNRTNAPSVPAQAAPVKGVAPAPAPAPTSGFEEPQAVKEARAWLSDTIDILIGSGVPGGVAVERFDREIKERIERDGRPGPNREAGWMEFVLLPALAKLDAATLDRIMNLWPQGQRWSFMDPEKTLSGKRFWAIVEGADKDAKKVFLRRVLPTIVDSEEWSSSLRFTLATQMLSWTKARPEAFEERLGLWEAWGGKMSDSAPKSAEAGAFGARTAETVESWIKSAGVAAWQEIVDNKANRPRRTPGPR